MRSLNYHKLLSQGFWAKVCIMVRLLQSIGRLSVRGYLLFAGFIAIAILASYSNLQSHLEIATQQAKQQASEQARTEDLQLKDADSASQSATKQSQPPASGDTEPTTPNQDTQQPSNGGSVQAVKVINGGKLIFSPTNITLSLSRELPLFTVSSPNGTPMTIPSLASTSTAPIKIKATDNSTDSNKSWSMQLVGKPKPGVYHLPLRATTTQGTDTIEYSGTLLVVVLL